MLAQPAKMPADVKFSGALPLNDSNGKPITARIAPEGVYVNLGLNGTKLMASGGVWNVSAVYPDAVNETYRYKLEKKDDGFVVSLFEVTAASVKPAPK